MAEVSCRAGGTALCLSRGFKSAGEQRFLSRLVTVSDSYRAVKLNSEAVSEQELQQRKSFHMDSNSAGSVQYDRWNEDNIHMNVEASQSSLRRICNSLCVGSTGKAVKAAGAVAALLAVYIVGYVTGYYIHRCP